MVASAGVARQQATCRAISSARNVALMIRLLRAALAALSISFSANYGADMSRYTVQVPESKIPMGIDHPLTGLEAYTKVCELRSLSFDIVTLTNVDTGEEITDVASLVMDSPHG
jgi:hypothetical protein